jgi:hypothetical protein
MLRLRLILLGFLAVLAISAVASASASAETSLYQWFVCQKGGSEKRENGLCGRQVSTGEYSWFLVTLNLRLDVTLRNVGNVVLKSIVGAIVIKIECTTANGEGWIENPTGKDGVDYEKIELTGCTVSEPVGQGCKVSEPIVIEADSELVEVEGKAEDEIKPVGSNFTSIVFTGCSMSGLNASYPLKGTALGIPRESESEFEFTNASTEKTLTFAGEPAKLKDRTLILSDENTGVIIKLVA